MRNLQDTQTNPNTVVDVLIDDLTLCLVHSENGEEYDTVFESLTKKDLSKLTPSEGWTNFNWKTEFNAPGRHVIKLMVKGSDQIEGLISYEIAQGYVSINLVESAPRNVGKNKLFIGVGAHLFAIACKLSFDLGFDGVVSFIAKTNLIEHYREKLGAILLGNHAMAIETPEALELVKHYFK